MSPRTPKKTRIYAIGDIHGRADLLNEILGRIVAYDATAKPGKRRIIIFLGDYVDRGPGSRQVISRLAGGLPMGFERVCLKGNHDAMMLSLLDDPDPDDLVLWLMNGGEETLASYGVACPSIERNREMALYCHNRLLERMPPAHIEFLHSLRLSAVFGDYFFVHAGVRPERALDAQAEKDLIWIRNEFLLNEEELGKVIVHGHTPVSEPVVCANRIDIDTRAWTSGVLTALVLEGKRRTFLRTGQDVEVRSQSMMLKAL